MSSITPLLAHLSSVGHRHGLQISSVSHEKRHNSSRGHVSTLLPATIKQWQTRAHAGYHQPWRKLVMLLLAVDATLAWQSSHLTPVHSSIAWQQLGALRGRCHAKNPKVYHSRSHSRVHKRTLQLHCLPRVALRQRDTLMQSVSGIEVPRLFIFGLGYVGLQLGVEALGLGWHVSGSVRSTEKADLIRRQTGIDAHTFDLDNEYTGLSEGGLTALSQATHLVVTVPPIADLNRDPLLALHKQQLVGEAGICGSLQWIGYLSTTSVYGDHDGAWVDEQSETRASPSSSGYFRLAAEREWLDLESSSSGKLSAHVFRLAGIYGPGRSALDTVARAAKRPIDSSTKEQEVSMQDSSAAVISSEPMPSPASGSVAPLPRYVSRVHVGDICASLLASMSKVQPQKTRDTDRIMNLADNEPSPRAEVMEFAAALLGVPRTAASDANMAGSGNSRAQRRAIENKRVSNARMRQLLFPDGLAFPSFREGLRHLASNMKGEA